MAFQDYKIVRTICVFPRNCIDGVISRNKQNAIWIGVKRAPGCCFLGKQCLVDSLSISDRIVARERQSIVAQDERKQIKGVRGPIITGYENLRSDLECEGQFHPKSFLTS